LEYEAIQTVIRVTPIIGLGFLFIMLRAKKRTIRIPLLFVVGWALVAFSTNLFWRYSLDHAQSQEVYAELASKDGAPRLFGTLFGWVYAMGYIALYELCYVIYKKVRGLLPPNE